MSLSWTVGEPIARCDGGRNNKRILRLNLNMENQVFDTESTNPYNFINDHWLRERKKNLSAMDISRIFKALQSGRAPDDEVLNNIYEEAKILIIQKSKVDVSLDDGKFIPLPKISKDKSERIMIAGPTGSGKSTYASTYIKEIMKNHKNKKFYIFSILNSDEILDKLKPIRVKIDDTILETPIEIQELANSVVLFDDIDTFTNKKIRDSVANLRDRCLSEGRHENITCICTNHQVCDYTKTRTMINDCSSVTFFPQSGGVNGIERLLKTYCGLGNKEIRKIVKLPSRWVTISKVYPMYILYETGCYLLGKDDDIEAKPKRVKPIILVENDYSDGPYEYCDDPSCDQCTQSSQQQYYEEERRLKEQIAAFNRKYTDYEDNMYPDEE
jgi:energy-coupling factor transporter ATP-binding protein EcfA2